MQHSLKLSFVVCKTLVIKWAYEINILVSYSEA